MLNYKTNLILAITLFTTYGLISGCTKQDDSITTVEKKQLPLELITADIVRVKLGTLSQETAFTGTIQPILQTSIQAQVSATVLSINTDIGKKVEKGQILAVLNNQDNSARLAQAKANLVAAKAQADLNRSLMERKRRLFDQGFISKLEYEQSQLEYRAQQENVNALQATADIAQKASQDAIIHSPITGYVTQRQIDAGQTVAIGQTLFEIIDPTRLEIKANISASEQLRLNIGQKIKFNIQGNPENYHANVTRIAPVVNSLSRNIEFFAEPTQSINRLSIGAFIEGKITQSNTQEGLIIPIRSIQNQQNTPYVWVIENQKVKKVNIDIIELNPYQEIALIKGLNHNDQVSLIKFQDNDQGRPVTIDK